MATILLVEDDEHTRVAMTDLLELGGHTVLEASDGEAGLNAAREHHPDVVLLDFSLPKMHGWAVAREIRNDPTIAGTPIVALTAHVMVATRETAMESGCDAYLTKPIHAESFEPWFNAFLEERGLK